MSKRNSHLAKAKMIKDISKENKQDGWISKASLSELHNALAYVEGIANAARQKTGQVHQTAAAYKIENIEVSLEKELKTLFDIFTEHDDWSFRIEAEMDRRMKPRMGNKFGAGDLLKTSMDIDTMLKDLVKKAEEEKKGPDVETDNESNLTIS